MNNKWLNPLSVEEKEKIKGKPLAPLDIRVDLPPCNHFDPLYRSPTIKINEDGSMSCTLCGTIFKSDIDADVKRICDTMVDVLGRVREILKME